MTEPEVPLAAGEINALRFWLVSDDGHLRSVTQGGAPWSPEENVAACAAVLGDEPRAPEPPPVPVHPAGTAGVPQPIPGTQHMVIDEFAEHPNRFPELRAGPTVTYSPYEDDRFAQQVSQILVDEYREALARYPARFALYEQECEQYEHRLREHREMVAEHIAPMEDCECGFYLVRDHKTAQTYVERRFGFLGVVQGYGRAVPMEKGWRVGKARILALAPWNAPRDSAHPSNSYRLARASSDGGVIVGEPIVERTTIGDHRIERVRSNYPDAEHYPYPEDLLVAWKDRLT